MEQNYNVNDWTEPCPKYDCRKAACKCGLKYVNIPMSLGDDSAESSVAPKNGAYCNALVFYEANEHVYIYTQEGVPTLIDVDASDISTLEQEVIKAQRDVHELREEIKSLNDVYIFKFDTVAQMKLSNNLGNGSYAKTAGFRSLNDGGGALYKITDTGIANEMDVIAVGDLYANLINNDKYEVKQYGAYADNSHDDTSVIQYVIDKAATTNGEIYFDSGKYLITDTLIIPASIKIQGYYAKGDSTTSIKGAEIFLHANSKTVFEYKASTSIYQSEIRNIRLNTDGTDCIGIDTSKTTFFGENIFECVYINGHFKYGMNLDNSAGNTAKDCIFSVNTIGINFSGTNGKLILEKANFWNNTNDICITGVLSQFFILHSYFENTNGDTNIRLVAPVTVTSSVMQNTNILSNSSNQAILVEGSNTADSVRLLHCKIDQTSIAAKTGLKINMSGNTSNTNALTEVYFTNVTFLNNTGYGIDTDYQNTQINLIDCRCYNNWYYGAGTMVNRTTDNRVRQYGHRLGLSTDSTINFEYASSLFYNANSLYLDNTNTLKWRFNDTAKTAPVALVMAGNTSNRPDSPKQGQTYFDTTLGKMIVYNGSAWVNMDGASLS